MLRPHAVRQVVRPLLAVLALLALLAALLIPTALPAGAANAHTDLSVSVTGPQRVQGDGEYSYTVVASNSKGPSAANGAMVRLSSEGLSKITKVECASSSGGAKCTGAPAAAPWEMSIATFPVGGSVTLKLTVTMGSVAPEGTGSGAVTAQIEPPAGVSDDDPSTDQSTQGQTVTPSPQLDVSLATKAAAPVTMGQVATHRFTWSNRGAPAVAWARMWFSGPWSAMATWRVTCVEGAKSLCPQGVPTEWTTADPNTVNAILQDVSMPTDSSVELQMEVKFAPAKCGEPTQEYSIFSDIYTRGPLSNVGSPGRVSSHGEISGFEPCPVVNLTAEVFDTPPTDLSSGVDPSARLSGRAVFTNSSDREVTANMSLRGFSAGPLNISTEGRCVATGGAECPSGTTENSPLASWTVAMPKDSTLTWYLTGEARQSSCSYDKNTSIIWEAGINPTDGTQINEGQPSWVRVGQTVRGLELCIPREATVKMEWAKPSTRIGEGALLTTTYTNDSAEETTFVLDDSWFGLYSYNPFLTIVSTEVTCVSDVCPAAYPRDKATTLVGRTGALDSGRSDAERSVVLGPGDSAVTQRVLTFGVSEPRCSADGRVTALMDAGMRATGTNIVGGNSLRVGAAATCHDDTIGVKVNAAAPGAATDVLVEVGNSGAPAREQRVVVALPKDGLFYEEGSSAAASAKSAQSRAAAADCVASEEIACPELSYDADAHTVSFALSDIPVTGTRTVKIPVIMGVKPAGGGKSYRVQAKVESDDQGKGEAAPNNNTAVDTFAVNNAPAPVSLALTVAGAAPTKDLTVTGTMVCRFQRSQELSGVIKSGTKALTIKGAAVYPGDECSLELNTVAGAEWVSGQSQAAVAVTGPVAWKATLRVAESEPGTDEGTQNASGTDEGTASDDASGTTDGSGTSADAGSETSANANADNGGAGTDSSVNADASAGANPENGSDPTAAANPDAAADEAGADPDSNAGSGSDADPSGEPDNKPDSKPSKDPIDVLGTNSGANSDANASDSAQGGDLPQTGGNAALPLTLAGLLAAAGALLLVQTRRRQARGASRLPGRHTAG